MKLLAQNTQHRTKASQLRDVMADVEEALSKGVPRKVIVSELAQSGLEMSLATFDSILLRERRKRAGRKSSGNQRFPESAFPVTAQPEATEPDEQATGPGESVEEEFAPIFGFAKAERLFIADPVCVVYANEVFERLKSVGRSLGDISTDTTDYREMLRQTGREEAEKRRFLTEMVGIRQLAISFNENLDAVYRILTARKPL